MSKHPGRLREGKDCRVIHTEPYRRVWVFIRLLPASDFPIGSVFPIQLHIGDTQPTELVVKSAGDTGPSELGECFGIGCVVELGPDTGGAG